MIVQALVRHAFGTHGIEETFNELVGNDFLIKYFEKESDRANVASNSIVLYMKRVVQNSDGSIKVDSNGNTILEPIYINEDYANELSRG